MSIRRNITVFFMLFGVAAAAEAQQTHTEFSVKFPLGSDVVEPAFDDNARRIADMTKFFEEVNRDEAVEITGIAFRGTTSPEASHQLNLKLARKRMAAFESVVRGVAAIPDELVSYEKCFLVWSELRRWVAESEMPQKSAVLDIIDGPHEMVPYAGGATIDSRVLKLKELDKGRVWRLMSDECFGDMRSAGVVVETLRREVETPAPAEETAPVVETAAAEPVQQVESTAAEPVRAAQPEPAPVKVDPYVPRVHLKTNVVGWGLSMANLAVEFDLCRKLSFALPIYYSGVDYFTSRLKFRTFALQPELRLWFSDHNDGWFMGCHFGAAWYNFAFDGGYRYQSYNREAPALGGGLSVGYRMPIGRAKRWRVEFAIGGGGYGLHYDGYLNGRNGRYVGTHKNTYFGIDNVSVAFGYTFDMKKGGTK